jgi:hypothetical protein
MKKKYYGVIWDNYMGTGHVEEVYLTKTEYKEMKETWCRGTQYYGIYDKKIDAEIALDRRYCD